MAIIPADVLKSRDTTSLFHDWTEEQWKRVAGLVLVIAIDLESRKRRYVGAVLKRSDFDLDAHKQQYPIERIQFMELPQL